MGITARSNFNRGTTCPREGLDDARMLGKFKDCPFQTRPAWVDRRAMVIAESLGLAHDKRQ